MFINLTNNENYQYLFCFFYGCFSYTVEHGISNGRVMGIKKCVTYMDFFFASDKCSGKIEQYHQILLHLTDTFLQFLQVL